MKRKPDYAVKATVSQRFTWAFLTLCMLALSALPVLLALHDRELLPDIWPFYAFIFALFAFLTVCSAVRTVSLFRPVVEVYGETLVFWAKKRGSHRLTKIPIHIDAITARVTAAASSNAVDFSGMLAVAMGVNSSMPVRTMRYKSNGVNLFEINSGMINAARLDAEIYRRLKVREEAQNGEQPAECAGE